VTASRPAVQRWVTNYERAWRTAGTDQLAELFTDGISYLASPWGDAVKGLDTLARFWESERAGPDEHFTMTSDVVAVEGDRAVVRVAVEYLGPSDAPGEQWRDLWVLRFAADGRCAEFEEWPFAPTAYD
jgi:hypothetical protein